MLPLAVSGPIFLGVVIGLAALLMVVLLRMEGRGEPGEEDEQGDPQDHERVP